MTTIIISALAAGIAFALGFFIKSSQSKKQLSELDLVVNQLNEKIANSIALEEHQSILDDHSEKYESVSNQHSALTQDIQGVKQDLETQWAPWEFTLKQVQVPVQVIQGKKDTFVPWQFAEHICSQVPDCQLNLIDDVGHLASLTSEVQDKIFRLLPCVQLPLLWVRSSLVEILRSKRIVKKRICPLKLGANPSTSHSAHR